MTRTFGYTSIRRLLGLALLALLLAGCTSKPVMMPQSVVPPGASEEQVQQAILRGLQRRGWSVTEQRAQLIRAKIVVRGRHGAEIDIPYSASLFSLNYRDSFGLDYKAGKIHRNYNRWISRLRGTIVQELSKPNP